MKTVGVIGIGNMGSGLAKNLMANGFEVYGHDLLRERMDEFSAMGGKACTDAADVGRHAQTVYIMVMNGEQVNSVIFDNGLLETMKPGGTIIITATIRAPEIRKVADSMQGSGIHLIDSPVSGGKPGAQNGTLTLMAAGSPDALDAVLEEMEAVSGTIHRVGTDPGMGQTVKACLQSLIGSIFTGTYEASVLAAKAGVDAQALFNVISTSAAGSGISNSALEYVVDRRFEDTGSHIATMHKDLTIVMDLARSFGVPMFTASVAMQLFQAGITRYPDGDNQVVAKIGEEIVGASLSRVD